MTPTVGAENIWLFCAFKYEYSNPKDRHIQCNIVNVVVMLRVTQRIWLNMSDFWDEQLVEERGEGKE